MTTDELLAGLRDQQSKRGDIRDCKSENEQAHFHATERAIAHCISGLMNPDHERTADRLADLQYRKAAVLEKTLELEAQISALPDVATITDPTERSVAGRLAQHLHQQFKLLTQGRLLRAPGVTWERLSDLDAMIADTERRLATERARWDSCVQQAEQLLGIEVSV